MQEALLAEKRARNAESARKYRAAHPHKAADSQLKYYEANKPQRNVAARRGNLRRWYGITPEQFDAMLIAQDSACAICATKEPKGKGRFHVDHCHDTGAVRALLCHHCNVGLGNFNDNPERLLQAASYLTHHAQEAT